MRSFPQLLSLGLAVGLCGSAAGEQNSAPQLKVALVYTDGSVQVLTPEELQRQSAGQDVGVAWIWSRESAPERHPRPALANLQSRMEALRKESAEERQRSPSATTKLTFVPARSESESTRPEKEEAEEMSATLIAAPAEMWARIPVALLPRHSVVLSEELELPTAPGPWRFKLDGPERASPSARPCRRRLRYRQVGLVSRRGRASARWSRDAAALECARRR